MQYVFAIHCVSRQRCRCAFSPLYRKCSTAAVQSILHKKSPGLYCGPNTLCFVENFVEISISSRTSMPISHPPCNPVTIPPPMTNDRYPGLSPTLLKAFFSDFYARGNRKIYLCLFSSIFGAFLAFFKLLSFHFIYL